MGGTFERVLACERCHPAGLGWPHGGRKDSFVFLLAAKVIQPQRSTRMATKAQDIYDRVEAMVAAGTEKADAFRQIAEEAGRPFDSVRGSYYSHKKKLDGGDNAKPARTRRRETTPDDALADARAALQRAIDSIDREVEVAKARADEAKAEYDSLKGSAAERKQAIMERLEALN
jgi:hypothetical protein